MSFYKKLKEIDDGSFDELLKKIEQKTKDKAEREKLLTEIVLHNIMRRCALNAQKDSKNLKASSESDRVPETLKNYMENLKDSDLNENQSRLSIPESKINADQFLAKQEIEKLDIDRALPVTSVEIGAEPVVETNLRLKEMKSNYVLMSEKWNEVKRRNEEKFKGGDGVNAVIQLWCFRLNSRLYFALNVVEEEAKTRAASTNGSNCGGASTSR